MTSLSSGTRTICRPQLKNIQEVYDLLGAMRAATDDLITVTRPEFNPERFAGKEKEHVRQQVVDLQHNYNEVERKWLVGRESLGFLMVYYHQARPGVVDAWVKMVTAMDAYSACAKKWRNRHIGDHDTGVGAVPCRAERDAADSRLAELTGQLAKAQYNARPFVTPPR